MEKQDVYDLGHTYFTLDNRLHQLALVFRQNPPSAELRQKLYTLYQDFKKCRQDFRKGRPSQEAKEAFRQRLKAIESEFNIFYAALPNQYRVELSHDEFHRQWQELLREVEHDLIHRLDNCIHRRAKRWAELCMSPSSQEIYATPYDAMLERVGDIAVKLDQLPSPAGAILSEVRQALDDLRVRLEALAALEKDYKEQMYEDYEQALERTLFRPESFAEEKP
jgi:hypothetical protein